MTDETQPNTDEAGVNFSDGEAFTWNMAETEESSGFDPMPKGTYSCIVDKVDFKISKSSGKPMWEMVLAISEGEFAEKNRKVFNYQSLKEEQKGQVKKLLNRVAPDLASLTSFDPKKVADEGLLVGRRCRVKLDIEESEQYGARNRVREILAPAAAAGGGGGFDMG